MKFNRPFKFIEVQSIIIISQVKHGIEGTPIFAPKNPVNAPHRWRLRVPTALIHAP